MWLEKMKKGGIESFAVRNLPPGYSLKAELTTFWISLAAAVLMSLSYISRYREAYDKLFVHRMDGSRTAEIISDAVMPNLSELLGGCMLGFPALALMCLIIQIIAHHSYHRGGGSNSYYTMRRLPDRNEYFRRCHMMPLIEAGLILAAGAAVLLIHYITYMQMTPDGCIRSGQWSTMWSCFLPIGQRVPEILP